MTLVTLSLNYIYSLDNNLRSYISYIAIHVVLPSSYITAIAVVVL